jgi:secreted trypsin-like serine protease
VSLRFTLAREKHFCGGAIISNRHILTAAQCVYNLKTNDFVVYIGRDYVPNESTIAYTVKKIKSHKKFIKALTPNAKVHHDIAVVTVS